MTGPAGSAGVGARPGWPRRAILALAGTVVLSMLCCGGIVSAYFFGGFAGAGSNGADAANANLTGMRPACRCDAGRNAPSRLLARS